MFFLSALGLHLCHPGHVGMDMAQVKCHGGVSLWRFLPLPNSPVADRIEGHPGTKNLLSLKVLILWYSVSDGIGASW